MKLIIFLLLLNPFDSFAEIEINKLKINQKKVPAFIKPLTQTVDSKVLLKLLRLIDSQLANYPARNTKAFMMTEFYKTFFQLEKNSLVSANFSAVSKENLIAAKKKLELNIKSMSKMSEFLLVEIFVSYQKELDSSENESPGKLSKINNFLGNWVGVFLNNTPTQFNNLVGEVSLNYLKNISSISRLLELHTHKTKEVDPLFPNLESISVQTGSKEQPPLEDSPLDPLPTVERTEGASEKIEAIINKEENKEL